MKRNGLGNLKLLIQIGYFSKRVNKTTRVAASVPSHFETAIAIDCPSVFGRATSMLINSRDINTFCKNAEKPSPEREQWSLDSGN